MKLPAIIDCDPGHDDAMAILLGARVLDLRAITTVHGNVSLEQTTRNARQLLDLAELTEIPVAAGADRPLLRPATHAPQIHGETGLDGATLPPPHKALEERHAVDLLIDASHMDPPITVVPVGPLTNIALAMRRDAGLAQRIAGLSLMGGSVTYGNSTPAAEFNIWCDAEAADIVFTAGAPLKMVGLNVTRQVSATPERREQIRRIRSKTAGVVADWLDFYSERLRTLFGLPGGSMHDPLAVAALVDSEVLTFEPMHVAIELRGERTYGMTVCDYRHLRAPDEPADALVRGAEPNAEVAIAVNPDRFWEMFLDVLATYP